MLPFIAEPIQPFAVLTPSPSAYQGLPDPQTVSTAGLLPRMAAYIADQIVLVPLTYGTYYFMVQSPNMTAVVLVWLCQFFYKPLAEAYYGKTLGKALLRLRVVDRGTDLNPTLNQSFIRYLPFAVAYFVSLFILTRVAKTADFAEVVTIQEFINYTAVFPLRDNFLISLCNNFPVFSAVWLILDPWNRALHDRWAQTFVIKQWTAPGKED